MKPRLLHSSWFTITICLFLAAALAFPTGQSTVRAASAISLRSASTGTNGAGAIVLSIAKPTGTLSGDVLVAQLVVHSASTVITPPSGWTLIRTTKSSSSVEMASFYKLGAASEPASYTWTFSASRPATGGISSFTGVDASRPIDASSGKYNALTAAANFTQVTTTAPGDMLLALVGVSGNTTVTPPSGFAEVYDLKNSASANGKTAEMSLALKPAAGLTAVASGKEDTLSASNLAQLIALRAAGTTPTSTPTAVSTTPVSTATPTFLPTFTPTATFTVTPTLVPTFTPSTIPGSTATIPSLPTFTPTLQVSATAPADSAIVLRSTSTGNNSAGSTSLPLANPAGTQPGDVLIAQIVVNSASTVITPPSGWRMIRTTKSGSSVEQASYYKAAAVSEPPSYTWTFGASQPATGGIASFAGVDTANPINASSGKYNALIATASFTQVTTTVANDMLLALVGVSGNTTVTPPGGFAEAYDVKNGASGNGKTAEMSRALKPAAGLTTVPSGKEDTLTASNLTQLIALRPASGVPTSTPTFATTPTIVASPTQDFTSTPAFTSTPTTIPSPTPDFTSTPIEMPTLTPTATVPIATSTSTPETGDLTVAVVGDVQCSSAACQNARTSDLVLQMNPSALLIPGDLLENGAYSNFLNYYNPLWGQFRSITHPEIGNHETSGTGYFDYWNGVGVQEGPVGTRGKGWYSFDLGAWHFVAINSNCVHDNLRIDCQPGSEEIAWLDADLAASPAMCTIAFMHHPYYSSSSTRQYPELRTIFQTLYDHNVELYFSGHEHNYQRFYPQDPNSNRDDLKGITEFVVGTGGGTLDGSSNTASYKNEAVQIARTYGVLKLILRQDSYDFQFLPAQGYTSTDSGSGTCH